MHPFDLGLALVVVVWGLNFVEVKAASSPDGAQHILAKATAWFANNGDKTSTPSAR